MNQVLFITITHYMIIPKQCHSNKYERERGDERGGLIRTRDHDRKNFEADFY